MKYICYLWVTLVVFSLESTSDELINAMGSLTFHLSELNQSRNPPEGEDVVEFTEEESSKLWSKINYLYSLEKIPERERIHEYKNLEDAYKDYGLSKQLLQNPNSDEYKTYLHRSIFVVNELLTTLIDRNEREESFSEEFFPKGNDAYKKMSKYLIPWDHPMKGRLDEIFTKSRATADKNTFKQAGFKTIGEQRPRSYIIVAKHRNLPGYLVKVALDSETRKKLKKESWEWFVKRCEGATRIKKIIKAKKIKHFTVPNKYIYLFPENPPPLTREHHLALLLVDDMNLTSQEECLHAWKNYITKAHLDELFIIISKARGSSYRPDNIAYTKDGTFAFIDTEYPKQTPDYKRIRKYLNSKMLKYWDGLIKNGGK